MHALDQAKQIADRRLLMSHDRGKKARLLDRFVIVAPGDIGADAFLPGLEDDDANHAGLGALLLDDRMQLALHRVELERHDAARLRADLQVMLGEILKIAIKPLGMIERAAD
ncbi:hypothetical protein [Bradyrhizobium canariense]|uniref:hypothetical protein n=1 Tax=Bradyrhizobium canariense TaxID=255045 RepID=UPI0018EA1950|nr:hypothetical protein [Bradyrhizobium canariense]